MDGITRLGIGTSLLLFGFGCSDTTSAGGAASSSGGTSGALVTSGGQTTSSSNTASTALGGASTAGGTSSTSISSQPATGGAISSGGVSPTGGASTAAGGKVSGGATGAGGKAAGGTSASAATLGGASQTGGSEALGGANSTGGVNSGGTTATAGSKSSGGGSNASGGGTRATGGVTSASTIGSPHSGEITFYDDNGNGTCSFGVTGEVDVAALGIGSWNNAAWCGACAEVSGSKGTLRVKVVNQCPSCGGAWDLDLNKAAFLKIEEERVGRYVDTWNFVPCGITTPVKYRYKDGSSTGWTAVMVSDTNLPITTLEWSTNQSNWKPTTREYYNYFVATSGFGLGFIYVRITAVDGQQLIDQLPPVEPDLVFTGQGNFH